MRCRSSTRRGKAAAKLTPRSPSGTSVRRRYGAAVEAVKTQKNEEIPEQQRRESKPGETAAACSKRMGRTTEEEHPSRLTAFLFDSVDVISSTGFVLLLSAQLSCRHRSLFFSNKSPCVLHCLLGKFHLFQKQRGPVVTMATKLVVTANTPTRLLGVPSAFFFLHLCPNSEPHNRSELHDSIFTVGNQKQRFGNYLPLPPGISALFHSGNQEDIGGKSTPKWPINSINGGVALGSAL